MLAEEAERDNNWRWCSEWLVDDQVDDLAMISWQWGITGGGYSGVYA